MWLSTTPRQFGPTRTAPASRTRAISASSRARPCRARLAEAGGDRDDRPRALGERAVDGLLEAGLRHGDHGQVDRPVELVDGRHARVTEHLAAAAVDQVDRCGGRRRAAPGGRRRCPTWPGRRWRRRPRSTPGRRARPRSRVTARTLSAATGQTATACVRAVAAGRRARCRRRGGRHSPSRRGRRGRARPAGTGRSPGRRSGRGRAS